MLSTRLPEFFAVGHCRGLAKIAAVQPRSLADIPSLRIGHVVARSPILTRDPTPFEMAYYNYQNRLRKALSNPFPFEFYFKPGSLISGRFKIEEQKRENWLHHRQRSLEQRRQEKEQEATDAELMQDRLVAEPRRTDADFHKNTHSLNRLGSRTLYLLLKELGQSSYFFPESTVPQGLLLHQAAKQGLLEECGSNIDTWVVGKVPIGFYEKTQLDSSAWKVFFFKSHVFAGQVKLDTRKYIDFLWLTKQEIESHVTPEYWCSVRDMLSDR